MFVPKTTKNDQFCRKWPQNGSETVFNEKKTKKKFKNFESPKKFSAQKRPKTTYFAENGPKMAQKPFLMKKK